MKNKNVSNNKKLVEKSKVQTIASSKQASATNAYHPFKDKRFWQRVLPTKSTVFHLFLGGYLYYLSRIILLRDGFASVGHQEVAFVLFLFGLVVISAVALEYIKSIQGKEPNLFDDIQYCIDKISVTYQAKKAKRIAKERTKELSDSYIDKTVSELSMKSDIFDQVEKKYQGKATAAKPNVVKEIPLSTKMRKFMDEGVLRKNDELVYRKLQLSHEALSVNKLSKWTRRSSETIKESLTRLMEAGVAFSQQEENGIRYFTQDWVENSKVTPKATPQSEPASAPQSDADVEKMLDQDTDNIAF